MKKPIIPESLYDYCQVSDPQFSPNGHVIAFVKQYAMDKGNCCNRSIWLVDTARRGAKPVRFSSSSTDQCPRWSPDGKKLAFISSRGGSAQIYVAPLAGGETVQVTNMIDGVSNLRWSPDGKWFAFNSASTAEERRLEDEGVLYAAPFSGINAKWSEDHRASLKDPREITKLPYRTGTEFFDGRYEQVYIIPAEGGIPKRLTDGDYNYSAPEWDPSSQYVYADCNRVQDNGDENFELFCSIYRYDINSRAETTIVHEVTEAHDGIGISPDGRRILHTHVPKVADPHSEPYYAAVSPIEPNAKWETVSDADDTVADMKWAPDSEHIYAIVHTWGEGQIHRYALADKSREVLVRGCFMAESIAVDPKGKFLAYTASAPDKPSDLYLYEIASGTTEQLTDFNKAFSASHDISFPKEIRWTSTNGVEIQGWYMYPRNYDPSKSYPLAVEIHGGPKVMWGNSFWHEFQCLASNGYFVFYCNPRGSAGYSADFARIREKGGYTDMPDIMNGLDTVLALEKSADPNRLAVTGGSYGGFLTGWVVTHTDRFKAAVSQRGCYDSLNMFGSGDIPESEEFTYGGVPTAENIADYWDYSPSAHAADETTPLLIFHSEQDYRVPISQAETFFAMLRRNGNRTVNMVRVPGEGHELSRSGKPHHRMERLYRIINWFNRWIDNPAAKAAAIPSDEMRLYLRSDLAGWRSVNGKLVRTVKCGNMDLAMRLMNKVYEVMALKKLPAELSVNDSELTIRLYNREIGKACLQEVIAAKLLNSRIFI